MSLDLQNVLTGHEPWSKTKQHPGKPGGRSPWERPSVRDRTTGGSDVDPNQDRAWQSSQIYGAIARQARGMWVAFPLLRPLPFVLLALAGYGIVRYVSSTPSDPSVLSGSPQVLATADQTKVKASSDHGQPLTQSLPVPSPSPKTTSPTQPSGLRPVSVSGSANNSVTVDLQIDNPPRDADVTIWVDDRAIFQRAVKSAPRKKLGIFGRDHPPESERVKISAGQHKLRVRTQARNPFSDQSQVLASDFAVGSARILRVSFNKHSEMRATLK